MTDKNKDALDAFERLLPYLQETNENIYEMAVDIKTVRQALTAPAPVVDVGGVIEVVCRRLHSQAYCNENVENGWMDFIQDAREIISDIDFLTARGLIGNQENTVKVPTNEDEAVLMNLLSFDWLKNNAPHRLKADESE